MSLVNYWVKSAARSVRITHVAISRPRDTMCGMSEKKQTQKDRFEQTAREIGVDLDEAKLAETLRKLAKHEPDKERGEKDE